MRVTRLHRSVAALPATVVRELSGLGRGAAGQTVDVTPHFRGAGHGEIVVPQCHGCERVFWYPALLCPACGSSQWRWQSLGDGATLDSWTVVRHPLVAALREHVPFIVGLASPVLAPHVRLVAALAVNADAELQIGDPLIATPGSATDGGHLLSFHRVVQDQR